MKVFGIFEEFSFLTFSNKVEKCLCIRIVCLSVCGRSDSREYYVLKFIYVINIRYSTDRIENGTKQNVSDTLLPVGEGEFFLKLNILMLH